MPNAIIDGKKFTSVPAKVEARMKAGEPKRQAMSTSGKPMQSPVVKVGK